MKLKYEKYAKKWKSGCKKFWNAKRNKVEQVYPYMWIDCLDNYWFEENSCMWKKIDEAQGFYSSSYHVCLKRKFRKYPLYISTYCQSPKAFIRLLKKWSKYLGHGVKFKLVSHFTEMSIIGST